MFAPPYPGRHLKFIADYFEIASECKLPSRSSEHALNMQPAICILTSYYNI